MISKSSIHIKPCNIAQSEAHNRRDKEYLRSLSPAKIYIREELSRQNKSYVHPDLKGISLRELYDSLKVMVKEKTGRAMQEKEVEYTDKNGKKRVRQGCSPLREGVALIKKDTTLEDLLRFTIAVEKRWGIKAVQIHIHKDEGHYRDIDDFESWEPNLHAHIVWDWMDHATGKSRKLSEKDMSEMQDLLAEELNMQRGQSKSETGFEHLEREEFILHKLEEKKGDVEKKAATLESDIKAMDFKEEDLFVHGLSTDPLFSNALKSIQEELATTFPVLGGKEEWRDARLKAVKKILTDMQTKLIEAKDAQKQEILRAGKALYAQTKKDISNKIAQNQKLQLANDALLAENTKLRETLSSLDENAVKDLRLKLETAISRADRLERETFREQTRADEAQATVREILAVPEIKQKWKEVKHFNQQIKSWIADASKAISDFAKDSGKVLFSDEDEKIIGTGIIAEAHLCGLDPTDEHQRKQAANSLIGKVDWKGTTPFAGEVAQARTRQLSDEMMVTKEIVAGLLLAAGGRGFSGVGGGGSNSDLTNWDGTKKRSGWGR